MCDTLSGKGWPKGARCSGKTSSYSPGICSSSSTTWTHQKRRLKEKNEKPEDSANLFLMPNITLIVISE